MIQQNNNNNYPCLEMSGSPREVLQKCQRSYLPFTGRLELGDMPLVKGLRAWAACSKNRRRAAPPPRSQGTCPRPADVYPVGQWGRLGYGLGLPLDSNYASNPRQTGLGALVTVATLKASEGGGQTQTRLFLKTEGGRCLYSTGSPRPCTQGLAPQYPSTLVGSWLRDKVGGVRDSSMVGKMGVRDMGGASELYQVKSRSARRWRTSCKPVVPIQGRTLQSTEDSGERTLEGSQESRNKGEFPTTGQDTPSGKQDRGSTRSPKCSHAQTKTCTQCHGRRGGQGSSGGQREAASVCEQDQSSCGVEGIKEKVKDGTGLTRSKPCDSSLPPDNADPENWKGAGDRGKPDSPHAQEGLYPETSLNKEHFQDKLCDTDIHTGGKEVASGIMRHVEDFDGMVGAVIGFVDHIKSAECDSESLAEGELPNRWIDVQTSERHCCSERGCLKACSIQLPSPAGGSISTATDETSYGQINQERKSDSQYNKLCVKCLPEEKYPVAVDKEVLQKYVHGLCEGEEGIQSTASEIRELCGEHGEILPEVRSTDDEARLVGGDITSQRTERGPHWATEEHESEETCRTEERCFSDLPATLTEDVGGGGGREAGTGQFNSLLRASAAAGPATSVTHSPPNPASSGAMATGFPAPNGGQTDAGGGALVPLLRSPGEQEWKRGWDESKVAADEGFLDGGPEAEDDFGLFMQAEEQPPWDDRFTASPLVPSGKSESVALENHSITNESTHWTSGWTDGSFQQSEDAWTAFPKDSEGEGQYTRGQWWPTNAVEKTRGRFSDKQNVNNVFVESFPSLSTPLYDCDAVPMLSQLLRGILDHESSAEDHGLLDGFHDLNKMFGFKYKRANAVSRERLLQSLHLGQCNTENMTGHRAANYSPSLGLPSSSQHAQACGKRRLSYDVNKNIME